MKLAELAAYAEEKYQIKEQHKWADFPGFSVLSVPATGKWAALLMRQKDPLTGAEVERCDIKCGEQNLSDFPGARLSGPFRMKGSKWVGVTFDEATDPKMVCRLFDRAVNYGGQQGFTIVLEPQPVRTESVYQDTPLPFGERRPPEPEAELPDKIRQMKSMYEYGSGSFQHTLLLHQAGSGIPGFTNLFSGHIVAVLELIEDQSLQLSRIDFAVL